MGSSRGMTMLTLVITAVMLILLAGITVAMSIGNSGILSQASKTAKDAERSNEKEQIIVSFNDVKRDKLVIEDFSAVTAAELQAKLTKAGANVSVKDTVGESMIVTYTKNGRAYIIDQNGDVIAAPEGGASGDGHLSRGSGTAEDPYLVQSIEDFVTFSQWNKNGSADGKYFKLGIDLNFAYPWSYVDAEHNILDIDINGDGHKDPLIKELSEGKGFEPIGTSSKPFTGVFDGNGKTITKMHINNRQNGVGLFGVVNGATITNINLVEADLDNPNNQNSGALVGEYRYTVPTTISNCHISGSVKSAGGENAAGLIGKLVDNSASGTTFSIENCSVDTRVFNQQAYNAVIVGNASLKSGSTLSISGTTTDGIVTVTGNNNHAGFVGYANAGTIRLSNCRNNASMISSNSSDNMAGFGNFGSCNVIITDCVNTGSITGGSGSNSAGFVSRCSGNISIERSYNKGSISGGSNVGGFIGMVDAQSSTTSSITNSKNSGSVRGSGYVGGFVGYDKKTELTDCLNTGMVNSTSGRAGGIVGQSDGNTSFERVLNTGNITGSYAGGIAGYVLNIKKCYNAFNAGTISGTSKKSGILYSSSSTNITYSYYLKTSAQYWNGSSAESSTNNIKSLEEANFNSKMVEILSARDNWEGTTYDNMALLDLPSVE